MQELHTNVGGGGRFFDGGGDRRIRPHHHQNNNNNNNNNQQALKCPRCDSLNTKFCYYNNYNLSQPRHFCKSCRRYWTKGGVLRNVPVGGGCRKSKRSKPKAERPLTPSRPPPPPAAAPENHKSSSNSSSESSSLAAATTVSAAASEVLSAAAPEIPTNQSTNPNLEFQQGGDCGIFSEIGSFTSLINTTSEALSFGFGNMTETTSFRFGGGGGSQQELLSGEWQQKEAVMTCQQDMKLPEMMMDPTVEMDLAVMQGKDGEVENNNNGGFGALDWQGGTDQQGLFDLPHTVDHAYWSQHTHWTDQENPTLFHLP